VSEHFQQEKSASAPVGTGVNDFAAEAFDHRVDGFHLPALSVTTLVQMAFHLLSISTHRFPGGRTAVFGGDQGLNPQFVAGQLVIGFAAAKRTLRPRIFAFRARSTVAVISRRNDCFTNNRSVAFCRVVKWGACSKPIASHSESPSANSPTVPR
jgi:hypothetical protein